MSQPLPHPRTPPTCCPALQAYLPANTISSFFGGKVDNNGLWKPVGTAPLGERVLLVGVHECCGRESVNLCCRFLGEFCGGQGRNSPSSRRR